MKPLQSRHMFAVLTLAVAAGAHAQTTLPPVDVRDAPTAGGTTNLNEVSNTASRLGVPVRDIPASVEIIDRQTIEDRGKRSTLEVLESGTGFTVGSPGGSPGVASVRGFTGNGVRYLIDGVSAGSAAMVARPGDSFNLDRVEILRGPASVLYGEGAIGAAVNFATRQPSRGTDPVDVLVGWGNLSSRRIGLGSGRAIAPNAWFRVDVSASENKTQQIGNTHDTFRATGSLLVDVTPRLSATIAFDHSRDQQDDAYWGTPLGQGVIDNRIRRTNYNNLNDNRFRSANTWMRANVAWRATDSLTLRNFTYYFDSYRDWRNAETYGFNPTAGTVTRTSFGDLDHRQSLVGNRTEGLVVADFGRVKNRFSLGFDWNHTALTMFSRNAVPASASAGAYANRGTVAHSSRPA